MNDNNKHKLSVIIPAYRQARTIVTDIRNIESTLKKIRYPFEIIAVVDGYGDGTYRQLKKILSPTVKATVYMKNQGKGHAVRIGMEKATGDYVAFMDAGREIDPNGISMLLEHMEWYNADIIVGSKRHPVSYVNYPLTRRILSRGYQYIIWALFRLNVRDTQAGLKIFKRKVLKKVLPKLLVKQYAFDLEMLVVARHLGYKRIFEAPIKLKYNFYSMTRASNMRAIYGIWIDTMAIFYRLYILKYYDRKSITK
ncbi:MAG: glycosyl transferase family protein [Candidatus Gottesmanbacteria bacterium GW2011_GWA2_43_14]|uniref:Glycosyl transferase family protein n=1 Tax=Candidatus Gottesmanbacteria bacterium GW2011_GWA2_43_14 TaxID=1618443 RepID=A0A0G1DEN1_9BACT|nr:MAG: glycosyl transferase family protein [Candidatus Gottesmanbacteria bacterium GW2011_GWA2_43_14]